MEELHREEGQQESQEQLELQETNVQREEHPEGRDCPPPQWARQPGPTPLPVGAEGGGAIAQPPVQQGAVVLRQQVWLRSAGGLWVAWGGENGTVGWRGGGGLGCHLLVGRQFQRRQETWRQGGQSQRLRPGRGAGGGAYSGPAWRRGRS